jgi:hypothetical protein
MNGISLYTSTTVWDEKSNNRSLLSLYFTVPIMDENFVILIHTFSVMSNSYGRTVLTYMGTHHNYIPNDIVKNVVPTLKHAHTIAYCFQQLIDHCYLFEDEKAEWYDGDRDLLFTSSPVPFSVASHVNRMFAGSSDPHPTPSSFYNNLEDYDDESDESSYSESDESSYSDEE